MPGVEGFDTEGLESGPEKGLQTPETRDVLPMVKADADAAITTIHDSVQDLIQESEDEATQAHLDKKAA